MVKPGDPVKNFSLKDQNDKTFGLYAQTKIWVRLKCNKEIGEGLYRLGFVTTKFEDLPPGHRNMNSSIKLHLHISRICSCWGRIFGRG